MDVVEIVEMAVHADRLEHAPGIRRVAVREDEASAGEAREQSAEALVALDAIKRDCVHVFEEVAAELDTQAGAAHSPAGERFRV